MSLMACLIPGSSISIWFCIKPDWKWIFCRLQGDSIKLSPRLLSAEDVYQEILVMILVGKFSIYSSALCLYSCVFLLLCS